MSTFFRKENNKREVLTERLINELIDKLKIYTKQENSSPEEADWFIANKLLQTLEGFKSAGSDTNFRDLGKALRQARFICGDTASDPDSLSKLLDEFMSRYGVIGRETWQAIGDHELEGVILTRPKPS